MYNSGSIIGVIMSKRKTLIIMMVAISVLLAVVLTACLPSNLIEGINNDTRKFSKHADYKAFLYKQGDVTIPYRLYSPEDTEGKVYPMIVMLHGSGERGINNKQIEDTFAKTLAEYQESTPSYILVPQCAKDKRWEDYMGDGDELMELINVVVANSNVDLKRIYLTGTSMGGYGATALLARDKKTFAAATILCGGLSDRIVDATKLKKIPMWVFHSKDDNTVKFSQSEDLVAKLKEVDGTVMFTEYESGGHTIWKKTYADLSVWDWLFSHGK